MARRETRQREAERRLRALLRRDPRNDWARLVLASVRADQNGADAEELYQSAADGFAARQEARGEVLSLVFLATHHQLGGRTPSADAPLARARALADATADPLLSARVRVAEAWQSYRKGDHGRALRLLEEVQEVVAGQGPPPLQSTWLSARAMVCWALGRHAEAMEDYRRQAEVLRDHGDRYEEAVARGNMVFMARTLGLARPAIRPMAEELLAAALTGGNRLMEARAHDYLSSLTSGQEAVDHARQFLLLSRRAGQGPAVSLALRRLATLQADQDPEEAWRLVGEAEALARRSGDLDQIARVQIDKSRIAWTTGPRTTALAESLAALDAVEATRRQQPEALVRARRFSQWGLAYKRLVGDLLSGRLLPAGEAPSAADVELAFHVSERRRARMLLDELDAARATAAAPKGPAAEGHARALAGIVSAQRRLTGTLDEAERARALADLARAEREEEGLRAELARSHPGFAELQQPRLATLGEVGAALEEDEALLAFQVAEKEVPNPVAEGSGACWLIVQTRHGTRLYPIPVEALAAVPLFQGLFERRDGSEAVPAARLGTELLERALRDLPAARRLIIVPDHVLHTVPFDALRVGEGGPLGARYDLSIVPSATLWLRLRRSAAAAADAPALALSDPEFTALSEGPAQRQWALDLGARLGPLPHARQEGGMIVRRLGAGSRVLAGREASEWRLKHEGLSRYALIHFATHAVVDERQPERSAILLAPGAATEDGLLQVRELVSLDLRGRSVVLSTCRSASGTLIGGEGLLSLAHGFFQSGARTVVATLWPLRDDEAERLFDGFYRRLGQGSSVGEALAGARRERIAAGAPAAAWAGMVLLGDATAVPLPGGSRSGISRSWAVGALALVMVAIVVVRVGGRVRRSRSL